MRRRDVYAAGANKWGDPRARLIEPRLWVRERATVLTALGLPADPREHLTRLAEVLDGACRQVGAGLAASTAARIKDGKLSLARLEAAPPPEGFQAVHDAVAAMDAAPDRLPGTPMFAICGYQYAPRHADIADTQLWWVDAAILDGT